MSVHVGGERRFLLQEFERENLRFLLSLSLSLFSPPTQLLPISLSPRSSTSPSCTTTVSPPHQAGRARSSCESTPASSSDAIALPRSPWMSPTAEESSFLFFREESVRA